ncbi:MAG TPA: esterase [Polyangiaceae bacterium]|jgi:enterochelin esterase-like enzyme|nr:esterase [Polyangiaceae bacterium]
MAALACTVAFALACKHQAPPGSDTVHGAQLLAGQGAVQTDNAKGMLPAQELTWDYPTTELGPMRVVVLIPERAANARFPLLVAMHGRGEALKGPERGARGWVDDYLLPTAIERLHRPPITPDDLRGFVDEARLTRLNESLEKQPYQGLIVVCPYTPDILPADEPLDKAEGLARFVVDTVLPRAYRETPAIGTPQTTGIDGVSLGGRAALGIGLLRPKSFAVVASLQAAIRVDNSDDILRRAREAKLQKPDLFVRLLTSSDDYFITANTTLAQNLQNAGIRTELVNVPGPHDYEFNRGPGAYEMLMFHDRVLRGQPEF